MTRRTFGGLVGATVIAGPAVAAPLRRGVPDATILQLRSIPLAWPQYHRIGRSAALPGIGEPVRLLREAQHGFADDAIAVRTLDGKRFGYIPRRHNAALAWAMQRGEVATARISAIAEPTVHGKQIRGWGAFHIDVTVRASGIA